MLRSTSIRGSILPSVGPSVRLSVTPSDFPSYRDVSEHLMPCIRSCCLKTAAFRRGRPSIFLTEASYKGSSLLTVAVSSYLQRVVWPKRSWLIDDTRCLLDIHYGQLSAFKLINRLILIVGVLNSESFTEFSSFDLARRYLDLCYENILGDS